MIENLTALSGVAYEKLGAIFPSLVAPTPAPTPAADEKTLFSARSEWKIRVVAGYLEVAETKESLVAVACNHPDCLVLPFGLELIRLAA
ncbi:MAG: hypothetical protein WCA38_17535 [Candidatus Acidiferrales bacterium]